MPMGFIPVGDYVADEEILSRPWITLEQFDPQCMSKLKRSPISGPAFPLIDAHTHFGRLCLGEDYEALYDTAYMVERMKSHGVVMAINMDGEWGENYDRMLRKLEGFEDFFLNFATVDVARFEDSDFEKHVYQTLKKHKENGVVGTKLWKNIGLGFKDKNGRYLMLDDPRLECIFKYSAEFGLPVTVHTADPPQFFLPIDEKNERYEELKAHPEWAFTRPGMPSFDELMERFEKVLASNPDTVFIGAHMIVPEDMELVSRWLDSYPNFHVDFADRLNEIGRHPYSTRAFFEKYQDRLMFATDTFWPNQELYPIYYRFLETFDEYFPYNLEPGSKGRWNIYGIGLPEDILKKIYYKNVLSLLGKDIGEFEAKHLAGRTK